MEIRDMIIDIDQMNQNNRDYSRTRDRQSDHQREDETARLTMEILHNFELAGLKNAREAIMMLRKQNARTKEGESMTKENFKCRAEEGGYCQRWLRECVAWNNCNLSGCGAPCPGCVHSSPLDNPGCDDCEHKSWKAKNYID